MAWRLVRSLTDLRAQVNALAPNRSKVSDGTIGDPAHSSRTSAHNPDANELVHAWDCTHDPAGGCDAHALAQTLLTRQDPRLRLVISSGRIGSGPAGPSPGVWRPYSGANRHDKHAHIEAVGSAAGDRPGLWALGTIPAPPTEDDDMTPKQAEQLDAVTSQVEWLQREFSKRYDNFMGLKDAQGKVYADTPVGIMGWARKDSYDGFMTGLQILARLGALEGAVAALAGGDLTPEQVTEAARVGAEKALAEKIRDARVEITPKDA